MTTQQEHPPRLDGATLAAVSAVLGCKPEWLRHLINGCTEPDPDLRCEIGVMWCCTAMRESIGWQALRSD